MGNHGKNLYEFGNDDDRDERKDDKISPSAQNVQNYCHNLVDDCSHCFWGEGECHVNCGNVPEVSDDEANDSRLLAVFASIFTEVVHGLGSGDREWLFLGGIVSNERFWLITLRIELEALWDHGVVDNCPEPGNLSNVYLSVNSFGVGSKEVCVSHGNLFWDDDGVVPSPDEASKTTKFFRVFTHVSESFKPSKTRCSIGSRKECLKCVNKRFNALVFV